MHRGALILLSANRVTMLRASLGLATALAISASAAAQTWVGPFNNWNTPSNWSPAAVPNSPTAIVNFTGNTPMNPDISASVSAQSLVFSNPTGSYTLTSDANISLNNVKSINVGSGVTGLETVNLAFISTGSLVFPTASNLTITNNSTAAGTTLKIGPSTVIGANGSGGVIVDGVGTTEISGSFTTGPVNAVVGGLTKNGSGTLILSRVIPNTYGGGTFVNGGTLIAHNSIPTGGDVTVANGAQFNIGSIGNSSDTAIGILNLAGSGTFRVTGGSSAYYLNKLVMTGGSVDLSGTANFILHFLNNNALIATVSSSTTANLVGSGASRIQNDSGIRMDIFVPQGTTPSGIDLDAGVILSGAGANSDFAKVGGGTMRLTNPGNTANFTVDDGALRVDDMAALGSGAVTLDGGILQYGGATATSAKALTLRSFSGIQVLTNGANLTLNGAITQSIGLQGLSVAGPAANGASSTLTLGATNSYSGQTGIVSNAVVAVPTIANGGAASPIGFSSNAPSNLFIGDDNFRGTLLLTGTNSAYGTNRGAFLGGNANSYATNGAGGAIGVQNAATTLTMSGQLTGGTLIKTGAGTLTLTNATNDYNFDTYVEAGTLQLGDQLSPGGVFIRANSNVTVSNGATLVIGNQSGNNAAAPIGTLRLNGGTLRVPLASPIWYLNRLETDAAGGAIDLTGSTGSVQFTGVDPVAAINGNSTWTGNSVGSTIVNASGVLADITIVPNVALTCNVPLYNSFRVTGGGTFYMTAPANNAPAFYTVSQGRLKVDDLSVSGGSSVLGQVEASFLKLDGGALQYSGVTASSPMPIVISTAGGAVEVSNLATTLTLTGTIGSASGSVIGPLNKTGPGVLILNNLANTYDGGIAVSGGRLDVSNDAQLGRAAIAVNPFGTLRYTASTSTGRAFTLNAGALEAPTGVTVTMNGASVGGGFLRGAGTFALAGGTALNGVVTATSTNVNLTGPASVANFINGGNFTVGAGQTLAWNGGTNTSSGRLVVNGTANVKDFVSNGLVTINPGGVLANSGAPLVLGGGSRTLIGSAGAPGGTIALGGQTLELNGALLVNNGTVSGATNVNFGSLAKGAGSFGAVNIFDGGKFSPGNSPGVTTLAAASFNAGGSYLFELADAAGAPGIGMDFLDISGSLNITAGSTPNSRFTIEVVSLGAGGLPGPADNFDPAQSYEFVLATADAGITGFSADKFNLDLSGFANDAAGGQFSLAQAGNNLVLAFSPDYLAADFDEDREVDAEDLAKWKTGFGSSAGAGHMQGDADKDQDVDGNDFLIWQRQLGSAQVVAASSQSSNAVPEPTALALAGVSLLGLVASRQRRRRL